MPSPRGSSSDLERARASAQRLSQEPAPGERPVAPDDGAGYIRFSLRSPRAGESGRPPTPASVPPAARAPEPEPEVLPQFLPMQAPTAEPVEAEPAEPEIEVSQPAGPAEGPDESEDLIEQLVADAEEEEEASAPPSWSQVLEDCVAVSQGRAGIILDAEGTLLQASEQLPKNKLDAVAARLMQVMEDIPGEERIPITMRSVAIQLGAFWLTGLRVPRGRRHVTVGLLASSQLGADVLPALEATVRRAGGR